MARILGIEVDPAEIAGILVSLGLKPLASDPGVLSFETPVWRTDLDREIDLIEEVGRIHNYDRIPEDRPVTIVGVEQDRRGRIEAEARSMLTSLGYSEAVTYSFVSKEMVGGEFASGPKVEPIQVEHATRKQSNLMRMSLTPSLLEAAGYNEAHGNLGVRLFEVANVYHPVEGKDLPTEITRLAILGPGDFYAVKGVLEGLVSRLHARSPLSWKARNFEGLRPGHSAEVFLGDQYLGFAGEPAPSTQTRLKLRGGYSVLEVSIDLLDEVANLIPQHQSIPMFPGVQRDLSLVVPTRSTWAQVETTVREAVDSSFESIVFLDSFRGGNLAKDEQSIHFGLRFRNPSKTMTSEEIDAAMTRITNHCRTKLGATVRT